MIFALQVNSSPCHSHSGLLAYRFIIALLAEKHQVFRVFFYHDGIYHAFKYQTPPDDELNLTHLWSALAKDHQIDLVVCISAAQRRGLLVPSEARHQQKPGDDLADGFRISGLGQLIEATLKADRFLIFE